MKFYELEDLQKAMIKARELSLKSLHHSARVGVVILQKKNMVAFGFNQKDKTHPYLREEGFYYNQSLHAEMHAIFKMKNKDLLEGSTVIVYREDKNGNVALSRPCEVCQKLLRKYKVKKIQYTTADGVKEEYL